MSVVGEAVIAVRPNLSPFKKDVEAGVNRTKVKPLKIKADAAGFKKSLSPLKSAVVGLGAAFAAVKVAGFFKDTVSAASNLAESLSKTRVVFGDASAEVERFAQRSATSLGISKQAALEATATLGNLFVALKIGRQPAADMSQQMVTLASDLASFNNVKPEEALEALRSGLVGETEPLRRFGVNLNDATIRAKALELGLIKSTKDALTPAAKAQAAYGLIMEQTTTAQGDFQRTGKGLANQQRILAAQMENLKASIGGGLLPVVTSIINRFNDAVPVIERVVDRVEGFIDTVRGAKDWEARISIVWDKIGEAKAALSKALFGEDLFKGQQTIHMPGLVDGLKQSFDEIDWSSIGSSISDGLRAGLDAAAPIAESMGSKIDEGIAAIRARMPQFATLGAEIIASIFVTLTDPGFWLAHWQLALGVAIAVVPIGKFGQAGKLIVGALAKPLGRLGAELIAKITPALARVLAHFPAWVTSLGSLLVRGFKAIAALVGPAAGRLAEAAWQAIQRGVARIPGIVRLALSLAVKIGIVQTAIDAFNAAKNFGAKVVSGITDKVKTVAAKVLQFITQIPGVISAWVSSVYSAALSLGSGIIDGVVAGIRAKAGKVGEVLGGIARSAISKAKQIVGIGSPSKMTRDEIGKPLVQGMIVGVQELSDRLKKALSSAVKDAVVQAKANLSSLAGSLSSSLNALLDRKLDTSAAGKNLRAAAARQAELDFQQQKADLLATIGSAEATDAERTKAQADLDVLLAQRAFDLEQAKTDAQKAENEQRLADLATALNRGLITQEQYQEQVKALLAAQGADYKSAGDQLGLAFADGFLAQLKNMIQQSVQIAKAGLPDLNELREGATTNPITSVQQELADARARLREVQRDAREKGSAGGTKVTKNEQKAIDAAKRQEKLLQDLLDAMLAVKVGAAFNVVSDPNGLAKALGLQITAAAR